MKDLENLQENQMFALVLSSSDVAVYDFFSTRKDYDKFKNGMSEEFSEERKIEMETLALLENLGYPMEELGTNLYKNMIVNLIDYLNNQSAENEMINDRELILQLKNPFSQFYVDVARNDLDMGIKTFHKHIENALLKVDYSKRDPILLHKIYNNNFNEEIDCGENALILASYMTKKLEVKKEELPKIKKLSNV